MRFSLHFVRYVVYFLLLLPAAGIFPSPEGRFIRPVPQPQPPPSIYYGVHATSWLQDLSSVTAFEHDAKKQASIIMWYQGWGFAGHERKFETTWMDNVRNHGSIPLVSWEPWDYSGGLHQPAYSLRNIISGKFDAYITRWAQDAKAWGHPYFLRFAAEMNGYWFSWSEHANGNSPGQYVQAWQHVHDIFRAQGARNATWVWCPNIVFPGNIPLQGLYPGKSYVDWVGIDGYNWSTVGSGHHWQTFSQVFQKTYNVLVGMSLGKPMMIAEMASAPRGNDKAGWIIDAFVTQLPKFFPLIKAFVWFNLDKETDWRIESSPNTRAAFAKAMSSSVYASNRYATFNVSPIPVP